MVGKVETEQKRQAWQASLDQLHQTIREIIQAQKSARYAIDKATELSFGNIYV